jgi:hypothetical protein
MFARKSCRCKRQRPGPQHHHEHRPICVRVLFSFQPVGTPYPGRQAYTAERTLNVTSPMVVMYTCHFAAIQQARTILTTGAWSGFGLLDDCAVKGAHHKKPFHGLGPLLRHWTMQVRS